MGAHPTRILRVGTALQELHDFDGDVRERVCGECHGPEGL